MGLFYFNYIVMNYYKLTIAYDGTDYTGWNVQPGKKTIFQTLHDSYTRTFGNNFHLIGASRTDAGVHAQGQVARLTTSMNIMPEKMMFAWNHSLPQDIQILDCVRVSKNFHPWHNVISKTYCYYIFTSRPTPFRVRYGWSYLYPFDENLFAPALQTFVGTHNFAAFTKAQDERIDTIRTIDAISCQHIERDGLYEIRITGNKFMWNMIRRIIGAAVTVSSKNDFSIAMIKDLLQTGNKNHPLRNAPARGLVLNEIRYKN